MMDNRLYIILISLLLSGCSIVPISFTQGELKTQAEKDRVLVTQNQEVIAGPVTLYEAIARALKYNLDFHLEFSEKILAETELDLSKYELLPQ